MKKALLLSCFIFLVSLKISAQWNVVNVGTTEDLYSADYYSSSEIWIGSFNQFSRTTNGGASWVVTNPIKDLSNTNISPANVYDIAATGGNSAIATGLYLMGNLECILTTSNGGANWNYASTNNTVGLPRYLKAVEAYGTRAIAVGNNGRIARSINTGASWSFVSSGSISMITDVKFGTYDTIYACGDARLFRSVNGGATWTSSGVSYNCKSIGCDRGVVYAGSVSSTFYKSVNYGASYVMLPLPFSSTGVLYVVDKDIVIVAGTDGLYISRTGGQYWEKYILSSYQPVQMMDFNGADGIVVGNGGYALMTNNLGNAPALPIAQFSIQGGSTSACQGDSVVFLNSTAILPGYTYQWFLNGTLFSSGYDAGVHINTPGAATVTMIATNAHGSDTASVSINVTGHNTVNPFTFTTNVDTICNGGNVNFYVPGAQTGVSYQLRKNYVNVGAPQTGSGVLMILSSGATSNTNMFSIKASLTNGCFTDSVVNYKTIYSATTPVSGIFDVSRDTVCYNDTASLIIPNSLTGYKYTWYNSTLATSGTVFVNGNGGTIIIPLPARLSTQSFAPRAVHISKGCITDFSPAKVISVNRTLPYFTLENYNPEIGESVLTINNSVNPLGSYQWDFGTGATPQFSSLSNPSGIVFGLAGPQNVKLVCTTPFGCKDSVIKNINVINPFADPSCSYSQVASSMSSAVHLGLRYDNNDNLIYWYKGESTNKFITYSNQGDSLITDFPNISNYSYKYLLTKYNPKGIPKWTAKLRMGSTWTQLGDVETDTAGSIYCSYYHNDHLDSVRIYSSDDRYTTIDPPTSGGSLKSVVILKFDKNGIFQWYRTYLEVNTVERLAMKSDNLGNLYICTDANFKKYNSAGTLLWSKTGTFSDIDIDGQGFIWVNNASPYNRTIMAQKYDAAGTLLFTTPNITQLGSVIASNYIKIDSVGDLYMAGVFRKKFIYAGDTINDPFLAGPAHEDIFLCKMKQNGQQVWLKQFKSDAASSIKGIQIKGNHILLLASVYGDTVSVDGLPPLVFNAQGHYLYHTDSSGGAEAISKLYVAGTGFGTNNRGGKLMDFKNNSYDLAFSFEYNDNFNYAGNTITPYNPGVFSYNRYFIGRGALNCFLPDIYESPGSLFNASSTNVCAGQTVNFTDMSTHSPTSWNWSLPGGSPASSALQDPAVVFNTPGSYTVTLVAANSNGPGTTYNQVINVYSATGIGITGDSVICLTDTAHFLATVTGSISSYQWQDSTAVHNWTDISGATGSILSVDYFTGIADGNKYRCLVSGSCGNDTSSALVLRLYPMPVATISPSTTMYICPGDSVIFNANTGPGLSYAWLQDYYVMPGASGSQVIAYDPGLYAVITLDSNGCSNLSPETEIALRNDCDVWPGDADNTYSVDNTDMLPIGIYFGQSGSARTVISNTWMPYPAAGWGVPQLNGADVKHVDCNGDGTIDDNDTLAVNLNFSSVHALIPHGPIARSFDPELYFATSASLYLPGDWIDVDIMAGTGLRPVTDLYGIAFNISYDMSFVQPGTESLIYPVSWLGDPSDDAIKFARIDASVNTVFGAETRTDHFNRDGYGKIATFRFRSSPSISSASIMNFSFSGYAANDSAGNALLFHDSIHSIVIDPTATGIAESTGSSSDISVYPNPYSDHTTIGYVLKERSDVNIEVYNAIGQNVQTLVSQSQAAGSYNYDFSAKELGMDAGIYFVKISIDGETIMKRIVEMK